MSVTVTNNPAEIGRVSTSTGTIELNRGQAHSIGRKARFVRVISGVAWVTLGGKDFILADGEEMALQSGRPRAVITAVGEQPIIYEVR
jgi:hypothetical protein